MRLALALILALVLAAPAAAAGPVAPPVMLVVDVSGSMGDDDGSGIRKIDGAKTALLDFLGSADTSSRMGLWTYPDQGGSSCNDGRKVLSIANVDPIAMGSRIRKLEPDGDTPTAEAMKAVAAELEADNRQSGADGGTLVIVSDGESTCADPCALAKELATKGFDLETITVGFNISEEGREELECISAALGGRYLDIDESDELTDTLDRLSRPRLQVSLPSPDITAAAGGDYVDVPATITNDGEIEATDMVAQLYLGAESQATPTAGFDVRRPVVHLGNLAPHATIDVVWRVRAGGGAAGRSTAFTAGVRAVNASTAGTAAGTIRAEGVTTFARAGKILKGPGATIAILGDSFSAGEGAGEYYEETNKDGNACHQSPKTYLMPQVGSKGVELLACSGAKTPHVWGPNDDNGQVPQAKQLADRSQKRRIRAVVMTMGGNDVEFGPLTRSCITAPAACSNRVFLDIGKPNTWLAADDFVRTRLGPSSPLKTSLVRTYIATNRALNSEDAVTDRGAVAPILVLAYPFLMPYVEPACAPMGYVIPSNVFGRAEYLINGKEVTFATDFEAKLNAVVETAVEDARRNYDVPVFYVPTTELAFMPRHTLCDAGKEGSSTEPFGRTLGFVIDVPTFAYRSSAPIVADLLRVNQFNGRRVQQLAHPTGRGYEEESYAILRWSTSKEAAAAVKFLATAKPAAPAPTVAGTWDASDVVLGPGTSHTIQGGTTYPIQGGGFAPDAHVQITIRSEPRLLGHATADERGEVRTRVAIPVDMETGDHTIELSGPDTHARLRTVRIPVSVDGPFRPPLQAAMGAGAGACLLIGFALMALTGRLGGWRRRLA